MYRLYNVKKMYHFGFNKVTPFNSSCAFEIKCSFCRKLLLGQRNIEDLLQARHQSTKTVSILKSTKKRSKHKNYKKYGELLEVNNTNMMETKVTISKLNANHLQKLASSPVTLEELHQLTTNSGVKSNISEIDPELLQTVKNKILQKSSDHNKPKNVLEDDKCALIYTNIKVVNLEDKFRTKEYIDMVKNSYYNFRKATIYDQRLQDLQYAINEGLNQEFNFETSPSIRDSSKVENPENKQFTKGPHAIFRELFVDNQLDSYDQELMNHLTHLQSRGIAHPAIEDICDEDAALPSEIAEIQDPLDVDPSETPSEVKSLKIKKMKQAMRKKKKIQREKRKAAQEINMKQDIKELEQNGKQEAVQRLLVAHLQLLCSLNMIHEGHQILQYYRRRGYRHNSHPKISDVKVYNTMLHGYASTGQLECVKQILSYMAEEKVDMNSQTFVAVFESIERCQIGDKVSLLKFYHQRMQEKDISLNDLLDKAKFLYDQREVVLKAIRRLQPDFQPLYTPYDLDYECPLMDQLKLDSVDSRRGLLKSPAEEVITLEELKARGKKQLEIEMKGEIEVKNIDIKDEHSPTVKLYRQKLKETESDWRKVVKEAFIRNLGTLKSQSSASHAAINLYPYLKVLEVDQFVDLIMAEISKLVDGSETYSPTLKTLQRDIGTQVYHKYQIEQYRRNGVLKKIEQIYDKYCEWYVDRQSVEGTRVPYNGRQVWQQLMHLNREGASMDIEETLWPIEMKQNVGKFLYNIIVNDVKIDINMFKSKAKPKKLPAVYRVHRPWGRLVRLELKPHPLLARLWLGASRTDLRMRAPLVPLTSPPVPWARLTAGAYLITPTPLIRMPFYVVKQWQRLEETPLHKLYPVLDSLNQLGEVPWVINKPILDLQLHVFRSGGNKKLDIPPPASSLDTSQFEIASDAAGAFKRRLAINRARAEMHSLWCDSLYKLSLANHYRDDIFWLPHNMDFRGRVYACPPHLSQLGADPARALLQFARQYPLGPRGLRWLKLHVVNLTGNMKRATIDERLAYAESIMDKILDSADNPLKGQRWWTKSEEPWQTLACCMEIAKAVRSPNHEEYMCGFPVHQDGSCNGLQHYAALGGDAAGAAAVNLAPADRPQDVYSAVAAMVEEMRIRDAATGVPAAVTLDGFVRRKVIKQTVMTTVYGVTRFGARLQIAKQLKDIDSFPKEHVWTCSNYLTARTFDSLREMFSSTKLIQDWFTDCAKLISGVCGESVEWVTPLGLPVVQPYYRRGAASSAQCRSPLDYQQRPCTMKQRNAFPPNFIHSLDSSHMMLTGLHCQAQGLTFVSVHDCFWTHPHTVDDMNKMCREQFVALHSQPILNDLSDYLVQKYSYAEREIEDGSVGAANKKRVNSLLHKVPNKGDFDLNSVLHSVYFFS